MISEYQGPTPTDRFVQSVLLDYSEGDHDFEKELITSYMTSVEEHLPQLSSAFETKDTKGAILHSHDIKGSSSYIGAEAVRYLSGKIEAYCKSDQLEEAESFFPELQTEVTEVFKVLNDYMNSWDEEGGGQDNDEEATTEKDSTTSQDSTNKDNYSPSNDSSNSNNSNINGTTSNNNNNNNKPQSNHDSSSSSPVDQVDNKLKSDKIATETVNSNSTSTKNNNNIDNNNKINEKINSNNNSNTTSTKIDS